jgi:subtilisin-like proprotein convertase family protein
MQPKRSRLARLGVLALALCLGIGMTAGVAEAQKKKKKKKAGGTAEITQTVGAPVPDATASLNGQLISTIDVAGKKFKKTRVRDVDVTIQTIGNNAASAGDLYALLSSPNGTTVFLFSGLSGSFIGPLTLSDQSNLAPGFTGGGCLPGALDPNTLCPPYQGTAQPGGVLAAMNDGPANGTWTLRVVDFDDTPPGVTSTLNSWTLKVQAGKKYLTK